MAMKRMWSKGQVKNLSKEVIESGLVDNAKPIYYHPISCYNNTLGVCSFLILNNNPTTFTKDTIMAEILKYNRLSPLSGAISANSKTLIIGYGYKDGDDIRLMGMYTDGSLETGSGVVLLNSFILDIGTTLYDGVNKIN